MKHGTRRNWLKGLGAATLGGVLPWGSALAEGSWKIIELRGHSYVAGGEVGRFYRFEKLSRDGSKLLFYTPTLNMRWSGDSTSIYINNVKFNLSFPAVEHNGDVYVSVVDLQKLIDPVLRPTYIKRPIRFTTVVIDAGHGGSDSGAKSAIPGGWEKNYALDVALRLRTALEKHDFKVKMTRTDDSFPSRQARVDFANSVANSIFVSVHFNSSSPDANGIETYALAPKGTTTALGSTSNNLFHGNLRDAENIALATAVHAMIMSRMRAITIVDRGIKRARFDVLTGIEKPGILVEGGFVTNRAEATKIHTEAYREQLAQAIADAIVKFQHAVGG